MPPVAWRTLSAGLVAHFFAHPVKSAIYVGALVLSLLIAVSVAAGGYVAATYIFEMVSRLLVDIRRGTGEYR
jgi:hypothetical protein